MCGRFTLTTGASELRAFFDASGEMSHEPRVNVAPGQEVAVIVSWQDRFRKQEKRLEAMHWGLIPSWARDPSIGSRLINARAETLTEKPAFRRLLASHRCLIPADGFYEWKKAGKAKVPMRFTLRDAKLFAFAGLWDAWQRPDGKTVRSCTLITTEANALVGRVHDRMPVVLSREAMAEWLDLEAPSSYAQSFLRPYPEIGMEVEEVDAALNDATFEPHGFGGSKQLELFPERSVEKPKPTATKRSPAARKARPRQSDLFSA